MRLLDHPNVIKLYHAEEDQEHIYIVLEHIPVRALMINPLVSSVCTH
jgi:serine/threonine protein kinase